MEATQAIRWALYLFFIYSAIGVLAWGFRVRLVNDKYELHIPKRPLSVALLTAVIMLLGMVPAYIGHLFGYMMLLTFAGVEEMNFIQGLNLLYIEDPLPWVPLSNLSVVLAAMTVWAILDRYDERFRNSLAR